VGDGDDVIVILLAEVLDWYFVEAGLGLQGGQKEMRIWASGIEFHRRIRA
jgi:hypothetical protein